MAPKKKTAPKTKTPLARDPPGHTRRLGPRHSPRLRGLRQVGAQRSESRTGWEAGEGALMSVSRSDTEFEAEES